MQYARNVEFGLSIPEGVIARSQLSSHHHGASHEIQDKDTESYDVGCLVNVNRIVKAVKVEEVGRSRVAMAACEFRTNDRIVVHPAPASIRRGARCGISHCGM